MRSGKSKPSGFPHRLSKSKTAPQGFLIEENSRAIEVISGEPCDVVDNRIHLDQASETSLWERLGTSATLNIESSSITWSCLSSLHHTEHTSGNENSEDELSKALEVTVNSGGVVFFALFNNPEESVILPKEAAAVIKITSSRLTTLSERLGYEFAKWLGVQTPQARVVHNFNTEWQTIKDAAESACKNAVSVGDELGEMTCFELLEALEMSRCVLLMNYVHGSPLLKSMQAFDSPEAAGNTAAALGRIMVLDLVLRNEDRLPCPQLGWRGNPGNLLFVDKITSKKLDALDEIVSLSFERNNPDVVRSFPRNRKVDSIIRREPLSQSSVELNEMEHAPTTEVSNNVNENAEFHIVAIDIGVPRRPPAGKRAKDKEQYPKLVELILNSPDYSSNILHEISGGKLGYPAPDDAEIVSTCSSTSYLPHYADMMAVVHKFRCGFRDALMDLQSFHLFLLTLHQKLEGLFRILESIVSRNSEEHEKDEHQNSASPHSADFAISTPLCKERLTIADSIDSETHRSTPKSSPRGESEQYCRTDSASNGSRGNWSGKYFKGSGDQFHRLRLSMKIRDFQKFLKADAEANKEFEQWIEMLQIDVVKFCL